MSEFIEYDIFLSVPMSGLSNNEEYILFRNKILNLYKDINYKFKDLKIYFSGYSITDINNFLSPEAAFENDLYALLQSRYFILIYPQKIVSSVLIELGYALANKIKIQIYTPDKQMLPHIVKHLDKVYHDGKIFEYREFSEIIIDIEKKLSALIDIRIDDNQAGKLGSH